MKITASEQMNMITNLVCAIIENEGVDLRAHPVDQLGRISTGIGLACQYYQAIEEKVASYIEEHGETV